MIKEIKLPWKFRLIAFLTGKVYACAIRREKDEDTYEYIVIFASSQEAAYKHACQLQVENNDITVGT